MRDGSAVFIVPSGLPGGHTAVNVDGVHHVNPTREFVVDGGTPLPQGTVVFELGSKGDCNILGTYV